MVGLADCSSVLFGAWRFDSSLAHVGYPERGEAEPDKLGMNVSRNALSESIAASRPTGLAGIIPPRLGRVARYVLARRCDGRAWGIDVEGGIPDFQSGWASSSLAYLTLCGKP